MTGCCFVCEGEVGGGTYACEARDGETNLSSGWGVQLLIHQVLGGMVLAMSTCGDGNGSDTNVTCMVQLMT